MTHNMIFTAFSELLETQNFQTFSGPMVALCVTLNQAKLPLTKV